MAKLKVQFHVHTGQDPVDNIAHSETQMIDRAAKLGYDAVAITCHNVVIFNDQLKKYAEQKRILLIPAIEKSIHRKHVLILNADIKAQQINSFEDLKKYREQKKDIFVIAAHPYYPAPIALGKALDENIGLFDAIEYSWYHTKKINRYNLKAVKVAEKHNLPVIATSDNHLLKYFDNAYSLVEAEKNIHSIFTAIKSKKIEIISHDLKWWEMFTTYGEMAIRQFIKMVSLK